MSSNLMTLFAGDSGAGETTITIQPDPTGGIDTHIEEALPDSNYAVGANLIITNVAGNRRIGLIKFDLSALVGKSIVSAVMSLWSANTLPNPGTLTAYRILVANSSWTEGDATWNFRVSPVTPWAGDSGGDGGLDAGCTQSGVDYSATDVGHVDMAGQVANTELQLALDVTEFSTMVLANYGMVVFNSADGIAAFRSSDYVVDITRRPKLTVVYTG